MRNLVWGITVHTLVIGAGITVSATATRLDRWFFVGIEIVVLATISLCSWIARLRIKATNRPADVAFDLGFQMGYDRGFVEGRRTSRPVLVPLQRVGTNDHLSGA